MKILNGYRQMWMMVMFDLPVVDPVERKAATNFRNFLLEEGFEMSQFSVYLRFCGERSRVEGFVNRIKTAIPEKGEVSILSFTDKQFGEIISLRNKDNKKTAQKPDQLMLF